MTSPPIVLIVEGDAPLGASLTFALGLQGLSARSFATGAELIDARLAPTANCLILDHRPPAADALALLRRLRADGSDAPAIVTASNPTRAQRAAVAAAGAMLVEKPLLGDALFARIRAALARVEQAA